jgi:hypothetical protein
MNRAERFLAVVVFIGFLFFMYFFLGAIDKLDQYEEDATVIKVERLDEQVVTFETESGNEFVECFDYEDVIEPQSKAILTIKEYEDCNVENDKVVKIKWVE